MFEELKKLKDEHTDAELRAQKALKKAEEKEEKLRKKQGEAKELLGVGGLSDFLGAGKKFKLSFPFKCPAFLFLVAAFFVLSMLTVPFLGLALISAALVVFILYTPTR